MGPSPPVAPPGVPTRRYLPFLAGAATSAFIMLVVVASGLLLYSRASGEQRQIQRSYLINTATAGAALVDVELHGTFHSPAQETTSAYLGAIARLERLRASNPGLKYLYTCVQRGDSVFFVLDPTPAGDRDGNGVDDKSHIQQPYPDAGPACRQALRSGVAAVDEEPYTDAWGTFISAYAPFFDSTGRQQGVVGVDMEIGHLQDELRGMRIAAGHGLILALLLSIGAGAGVSFFTRFRQAAGAERQRTLERLAEEKARAEEAMRGKADFLATMSHEIRTPLNAILGMLELLLDHPLEEAQGRRARIAQASAGHLLGLLNDILDYSKMEAGGLRLEAIAFDPAGECRQVLTLLRGQAEEKGLALAFRAGPGTPAALIGDPARFRQVLINLVGNAIKFTANGGVDVDLEWTPAPAGPGRLALRVVDTGIGITEDRLPALFKMFSQADASTTRQYGGTGLGLAICKRIADAMGGTLEAERRAGPGAAFVFTAPFPTADRVAEAPAGPSAGTRAAPPASPFAAPALPILLAEDNAVNRMVARQLLERMGCRVAIAVDGREAAGRAAREDFALVLMDCRMPEMDGYRATAAIRSLPGDRGRVPIVALTANAGEDERRRCREAGMDDFLQKPVGGRALEEVLRRWTGDGAEPRGPALEAGLLDSSGELPPDFLADLIRLFLSAAPEDLADLEAAVARGDRLRAARAAHSLSGAGAQMGAARLAGLCLELERASAGGGEAPEAPEVLAEVKREYSRVERELKNLLADRA